MKYLFTLFFLLSLFLSCSTHSKPKQSGETRSEEKEYTAPSYIPGPIPGQDPSAKAVA
jgi:preprotein translocase subunit SecG